ncbi:MAG: ribbon-helix-helix domain-containing protein [Alphaproteobacteria bacterium]|nr:ribbon-helix-helix domain-containing protein [Alphaproteobacteria bacterium]MCD8526431.1 ribbon-helix-helix domain-containing protein [Alphaproteobacteria bacterium]MCD8571379.1 ribbon-helix-helix domain-containing protein [Alphaproteobacteria bacterium]
MRLAKIKIQEDGDLPVIKSTLVSRNITVFGKRTSIRLEPEMWAALRDMAGRERCSIHDLCSLVSMRKQAKTSLTAAIRVFIMLYYKAATTEEGHVKAGHGDFEFMKQRARIAPEYLSLLSSGADSRKKQETCEDAKGRLPSVSQNDGYMKSLMGI